MAKILLIDDEVAILQMMAQLCTQMGHQSESHDTGSKGEAALTSFEPDLAIVDLRIPDVDGMELIKQCAKLRPGMPVVMVTGFGSIETAVEAMKLGAFDYLTKPFELDDLKRTINRALEQVGGVASGQSGSSILEPALYEASRLIGRSEQIKEILSIVDRIADNASPVLIEGEFGSGKQMVARSIHNASERQARPFKVLHCSALPEDLLEAELFGGTHRQPTIFERASGGTVLIEEINLLPNRLQSLLDSFLEDVALRRMHGKLPPSLDFRLIASSNEPLEALVSKDRFREDLFYRVSVIPVPMPPLRSRKDDIPLLVEHFVQNYATLSGDTKNEVDNYSMELLTKYRWPGNVGELQNAVERACALCDDNRVRPSDLAAKISQKVEVNDDERNGVIHKLPIGRTLSEYIKKQEKIFIQETLKFNEGSREKTASMLGVSIATLYRKMGLKLEKKKLMEV